MKNKKDFSLKIGFLEVRSYFEGVITDRRVTEIVKWSKDLSHCWTLAYWLKGKESYDLKFVGNRPFDGVNKYNFMLLAELGQKQLEGKFAEGVQLELDLDFE